MPLLGWHAVCTAVAVNAVGIGHAYRAHRESQGVGKSSSAGGASRVQAIMETLQWTAWAHKEQHNSRGDTSTHVGALSDNLGYMRAIPTERRQRCRSTTRNRPSQH